MRRKVLVSLSCYFYVHVNAWFRTALNSADEKKQLQFTNVHANERILILEVITKEIFSKREKKKEAIKTCNIIILSLLCVFFFCIVIFSFVSKLAKNKGEKVDDGVFFRRTAKTPPPKKRRRRQKHKFLKSREPVYSARRQVKKKQREKKNKKEREKDQRHESVVCCVCACGARARGFSWAAARSPRCHASEWRTR